MDHPVFLERVTRRRFQGPFEQGWRARLRAVADDLGIRAMDELDGPRRRGARPPMPPVGPLPWPASADATNARRLQRFMAFDDVSAEVLLLGVRLVRNPVAMETMDEVLERADTSLPGLVATLLGRDEGDVRRVFHPRHPLMQARMLPRADAPVWDQRRDLPARTAPLVMPAATDEAFLARFFRQTRPASLAWEDFAHLPPTRHLVHDVLRWALDTRQEGVHVLLHGPPGTGKSELARALAARMDATLVEVFGQDDNAEFRDARERLASFAVAQGMRMLPRALVLLDDADDVLQQRDGLGMFRARHSRAGIHQLLETSPAPGVWIVNHVADLDDALVRRFAVVMEVPPLPAPARRASLDRICGRDFPGVVRDALLQAPALTPAAVANARQLVAAVRHRVAAPQDADLGAVVDAVRGRRSSADDGAVPCPASLVEPAWVHANVPVESLARAARSPIGARVLLHGRPGTGKTAMATWMAEQAGRPLVVRRASDLLSMWVGGTEKGIADAFADAEARGAVLLLDEGDGLLLARSAGARQHEVTQVEEMLARMELFRGLLVVTTNLLGAMDPASMRRFDLVVEMKPPTSNQLALAVDRALQRLNMGNLDVTGVHLLASVSGRATLGDLAAAERACAITCATEPMDLVRALVDRVSGQPPGHGDGAGNTTVQ